MRNSQNFWDKNAWRYDRFMRKDAAAYERLYELLRPVVRHKTVLELATGTGLIAKNIVSSAAHIEATDASPEMIAEAKRDNHSAKLHFSVQDMFRLPYADESFDVIIVANALHIVPEPEKALRNSPGAEGRWRSGCADLHPRGELVFRQDQGIFHEAGGLSSTAGGQATNIWHFLGKRLDGAEKHRAESVLPTDLRRVRKIGGMNHANLGTRTRPQENAAVFSCTAEPVWAFADTVAQLSQSWRVFR